MENNYGVGLYQDGVFYFTNPGLVKSKTTEGDETLDWTGFWNNKEYTFKANTTVPLVIANEPPENIQEIRKRFARKYGQDWFHQSKRYKELSKKGGYTPAGYNEDTEFGHIIQQCLKPLPKSQIIVKELPRENEEIFRGSKAIKSGQDLNMAFKDYEVPELGRMN